MKIIKFDSKISWAVAVACGLMNLLILIPLKLSGLFFVEILDRYHVGRNLAGYPPFTISLMRCSGGPAVGYLAERFGMNKVMILGSLLSAAGISACFFAEDIAVVIVCLGVIHGLGVAFLNTFCPMIVKIHFKKYITLAFGVSQAGACIGAFFTPPLLLWIFQNYGTSGGFLIIGAMVLNNLPIVMIINILSPDRICSKSGSSMASKECKTGQLETGVTATVSSSGVEDGDLTYITGNKNEKDSKARNRDACYEIRNSPESEDASSLLLNRPNCDHAAILTDRSDGKMPGPSSKLNACWVSAKSTGSETEMERTEFGNTSKIGQQKKNHKEEIKINTNNEINDFQHDFKHEIIPLMDIRRNSIKNDCEENLLQSIDCEYTKKMLEYKEEASNRDKQKQELKAANGCDGRKDRDTTLCTSVNNTSSTNSTFLAKIQSRPVTETEELISPVLNIFNPKTSESLLRSNPELNQREVLQTDKHHSPPSAAKANKSLKIFLDVTFWVVIITQSLHMFVMIMFWTTMIDFSRDKNVDRSMEVYFLMALPIAEIIGRLGLGWITDCNYLTKINFCVLSFTSMGLSCSLMAWARAFHAVMASIFVFGVVSSGVLSVFPIVVFEFFDTANHTMGQASKYCLFGPLSFFNGPMIGFFRDTVGSYAWLYHTMALVSVACGALTALIPSLAGRRDKKKIKERTS